MNKNIVPYSVETLISEKEIKNRINELGKDVNQFYKDTKKLLVVGLLRGSFVFIADLVRELNIPVEVDFMTASSYGNSMQSSNNIRILTDLNTDIPLRFSKFGRSDGGTLSIKSTSPDIKAAVLVVPSLIGRIIILSHLTLSPQ